MNRIILCHLLFSSKEKGRFVGNLAVTDAASSNCFYLRFETLQLLARETHENDKTKATLSGNAKTWIDSWSVSLELHTQKRDTERRTFSQVKIFI